MVRVLVTGASGFIGHHLVSFLRNEGYWVRGVDLNPPLFGPTSADEFDLLDLRSWPDCLRATKDVDEVYALAADAVSSDDKAGAGGTALGNDSLINSQSLEAARLNGVRRYLYASSEHVYPQWMRTSTVPLKEEDALDPSQRDPKGCADVLSECLCQDYHERYGLETRIVRMHDVYGPLAVWIGEKVSPVVALCRKIAAARLEGLHEIDLIGDGQSRGSYLYIDDCVSGLHKIMRSDCRMPVNLDHTQVLSNGELAGLIASIAGDEMSPRFLPAAEAGGCHFDTTLLQQTLGWKPETPLEEGIKRTYRWVAEQVKDLASEFSFGIAQFPPSA
jgi:GDP-D-mannose 3',5'-epimerase